MFVPIEIQLLQDWKPRSRPTRAEYELGEGKAVPDLVKLTPGAAAIGHEMLLVSVENPTRVGSLWVSARIGLTIDGIHIGEPRPAQWFLGSTAEWSGVIHFPVVAGADNLMFRGHHSVLVRTP